MSELVDDGWLAPANPGPTRRAWRLGPALSFVLLMAWALLPGGWLDELLDDDDASTQLVRVVVSEDGTATVDGTRVATQLRSGGTTRFLAIEGELRGDRPVRLDVRAPAGVDPELVGVRLAAPNGTGEDAEFLVTVPAGSIRELRRDKPVGTLRALTGPIDERIEQIRDDRRLEQRLHDGAWWIVPFGVLASTLLPLALWRRARRRFLSMRRPGPGRELDSASPSSLDPVGAAVLLAGARPVDAAAAFAGHVLDLVERRQVRMRRVAAGADQPAGVQLGLAHVDEDGPSEDPAVAVLRAITGEDELTVHVPDARTLVRPVPAVAATQWRAHVRARERFERVTQRWPARPLAAATAASAVLALVGLVGALLADLDGARTGGLLVVALLLPAALVLGAWWRDARRWCIVSRERRTERAQWLAWRRIVGTTDGPALDRRNLPVLAATGSVDGLAGHLAAVDAVALDAATVATVDSLRAMLDAGE